MPNTDEWKWHLWRKDPKSGLQTYMGFFHDERAALLHKRREQAANPNLQYRVSNQGPSELAALTATARKTTRQQPSGKATAAMAEARAEARRRDAERVKARAEKTRKDAQRRAEDAEMMKDVVADAGDLLEAHKADEQADLEAGINH